MLKLLTLFLFTLAGAQALDLIPFADLTGANTTVRLTTVARRSCVVQVIAIGTGTVRMGNSSTSSSLGLPLVAGTNGAGMFLPNPGPQDCWSLQDLYFYVPTGVTVTVSYGG